MKRSDEACLEHILPPRHSTAAGGSTSVQTIRPNGRRLPPASHPAATASTNKARNTTTWGVAESEITGVSVSRTFTGFRRFGDAAQDAIMDRLYDLDNRKVKFIECYDDLGSGKPNGRQGEGVLSITDDGSGDAQNRENISFGLKILGTPQKGTVTIGEDGTPTFSPQAAEAKAASK